MGLCAQLLNSNSTIKSENINNIILFLIQASKIKKLFLRAKVQFYLCFSANCLKNKQINFVTNKQTLKT